MTMQNARHSILLTLNYKDNSNSDHLGVLIFDRTQEVREEDSEQLERRCKIRRYLITKHRYQWVFYD